MNDDEELKKVTVKGKLDSMKTNLEQAAVYYAMSLAIGIGGPIMFTKMGYDANIMRTFGLCAFPFIAAVGVKIAKRYKQYFDMKKEYEQNKKEEENKGMSL